ncbi:MAG TPA: hypothetical protein VK766_00250 [Cytophagaceae bacterium]|jgi:hypothetical protein|nr:hypothetical protein [Cytophagaceae bacterium]
MSLYEEKIELYLRGKLNAEDKLGFEEEFKKDPLLKNEVDLQNDIIESLKNSRKIQLKNRLNNIDVGTSTTGVSSAVKMAASFITVGIIGAGVYYLTVTSSDSKDKQKEKVKVVLNDNIKLPDLTTEVSNGEKGNTKDVPAIEIKKEENNKSVQGNQLVKTSEKATQKGGSDVVAKADVPNGIIEDAETDKINRDPSIEVPDGNIGQTSVGKAENVDVNIYDKNKKDFSYQFYSNKLFLYGDFNDQPYNLFEVNSLKAKQLYLYFDGKYYELKSNQSKITRLKEVKDPSVLKHLTK